MKTINVTQGFDIPLVAMGCMRIADMEYKTLEELVITATEHGANFFDHADFYGNFMSETRFGEVIKNNHSLREKIAVQTKCGIRVGGIYDSSYKHIMKCVDDSLRKMNLGYVDCLLIHRPDVLAEPDEIAKAFDELYTSGKVKYFGVSNHNPMQMQALQKSVKQPLLFNQMQMGIMHTSLIDHGINVNTNFDGSADKDGATLEYCKLNGIVLQTWSPFQYGFIAGPFIDNPDFPEINAAMDRIGERYGISKTALAVAWLTRIPAKVQVIAGTTNKNRMLEIIKGANTIISREDWYELYRESGHKLP